MGSPTPVELPEVSVTAKAPTPDAITPASQQTPAPAPYAQRIIVLTFQIGTTGAQTQIKGLRCFVQVAQAITPTSGQAMIRVLGLTLDQINQLTKAGLYFQTNNNNYVTVQAGDVVSGLTTIHQGVIYEAYPDFQQPESAFVIMTAPANVLQLKPVPPVSFNGPTPVATALTKILQGSGFSLENNGVNAVLSNPYFPGTVWQQALSAIKAADAFAYLDPVKKVLAVWPTGGAAAAIRKYYNFTTDWDDWLSRVSAEPDKNSHAL